MMKIVKKASVSEKRDVGELMIVLSFCLQVPSTLQVSKQRMLVSTRVLWSTRPEWPEKIHSWRSPRTVSMTPTSLTFAPNPWLGLGLAVVNFGAVHVLHGISNIKRSPEPDSYSLVKLIYLYRAHNIKLDYNKIQKFWLPEVSTLSESFSKAKMIQFEY